MDKKLSAEVDTEVLVQIAPAFAQALSADRLMAVAERALHLEGARGAVTVVITDDPAIRDLNRDFLGVDAATDVLAFGAQGTDNDQNFVAAPEARGYLGDVIISYPRAAAQAEEMGHATELEIDLLIVHGLLHLLGYDHTDEGERADMWARQDAILSNV
jgi:probable rRNA maturation factor